jgi:hypothetical protein
MTWEVEDMKKVKTEKLPKSFEEMQRHGLKITSWEEMV